MGWLYDEILLQSVSNLVYPNYTSPVSSIPSSISIVSFPTARSRDLSHSLKGSISMGMGKSILEYSKDVDSWFLNMLPGASYKSTIIFSINYNLNASFFILRGIFFSALFKLQFAQRSYDGIVFILLKL